MLTMWHFPAATSCVCHFLDATLASSEKAGVGGLTRRRLLLFRAPVRLPDEQRVRLLPESAQMTSHTTHVSLYRTRPTRWRLQDFLQRRCGRVQISDHRL